jgi:hypothetical protein
MSLKSRISSRLKPTTKLTASPPKSAEANTYDTNFSETENEVKLSSRKAEFHRQIQDNRYLSRTNLLNLQQQIGNRAVQRLVQQTRSKNLSSVTPPLPPASTIQRAIGLEIEVAVPVNNLHSVQINEIRNLVGDPEKKVMQQNMPVVAPVTSPENSDNQTTTTTTSPSTRQRRQAIVNQPQPNLLSGRSKRSKAFSSLESPIDDKKLHGTAGGRAKANLLASKGRVDYGTVREEKDGFKVDIDHDDRVKSRDPNSVPREGGGDSIIEIAMEPPANNVEEINQAMANIGAFINQIEAQTQGLTQMWLNPFGNGINIGPLDYPGYKAVRQPNHNYKGSIQVNLGVDLRQYSTFLNWYAKTKYSPAQEGEVGSAIYNRRDDIEKAVKIAQNLTAQLMKSASTKIQQKAGDFKGLEGWLTHLALYLLRGRYKSMGGGGSLKNITPVLMKSPNAIISQYGMNKAEFSFYDSKKPMIIKELLNATERYTKEDAQAKDGVDFDRDVFKSDKSSISLDQLTNAAPIEQLKQLKSGKIEQFVPTQTATGSEKKNIIPEVLSGKPIGLPTAVGNARQNGGDITNLKEQDGGEKRGGMVVEVRNIPGFFDGVSSWHQIALDFLAKADQLHK